MRTRLIGPFDSMRMPGMCRNTSVMFDGLRRSSSAAEKKCPPPFCCMRRKNPPMGPGISRRPSTRTALSSTATRVMLSVASGG
ncbi:MAG TPA: hypothetical protein DGD08_02150 [Gemmatimonas aurantiaca]|uniref:Uncharacterized protein n=1 Tax=Gemmatimonas aurantiaca TaxID=173480 RepID=A0A3D4V4I8_9BACT|nr:hypothetical protein [Gemmatimonas aurantiaca]